MASDYGLNFGFRRSDESMAVREGRQRVPAAGTFKQGDYVALDPANPGFLKRADANVVPQTGLTGLLVQEEAWDRSIYGRQVLDSSALDEVLNSRQAIIWSGAGTKVWLRNTTTQTRADGRQIDGVTKVDVAGLAIGDGLTWDGTKYVKAGVGIEPLARVTLTNGVDYVEAVLTR
jgi:hypothetical protein